MSLRLTRVRSVVLLALVATCTSASACTSIDDAFFSPVPVDSYELVYDDATPPEERVPPELQQLVEFPAEDGTIVYGAFVRRPGETSRTAPTVLYHHGNSENIEAFWDRAGLLWSLGANVLLYDYRGFGRTEGKITEDGIYQDARAALAYLRGLGPQIDQSRLFEYGYSIGGGPAVELAKTMGPFRGLVLESTLTSADDISAEALLVIPSSFLVEFRFDNIGKIEGASRNAAQGTLLFHGTADDFLPPHFSEDLAAAIPADVPHELVLIEGAGHDDVPYVEPASVTYRNKLREFLNR